ncbi:MAG: serine/threonine protein kinase [Deltaproteobacteria bacterium]|nr:serine/threonine protein kinase [Deltaproteobacteria bacterium]
MNNARLPSGFDDLRGSVFADRYQVDELLDTGFRRVRYGATDTRDEGKVVIRLTRPPRLHDEATVARLAKRTKAAARIRHPVLETVLDTGEQFDGKLYAISSRPPGMSLAQRVADDPQGRLSWPDTRRIALGLAQGLAAAHAKRTIHGAIDPWCCWVSGDAQPSVRLLELGTDARPDTASTADLAQSRTTALMGDATYMAPECVGGVIGDARSDLYRLGLTMYFMLAGRPPFLSGNGFQMISMHLQSPVPPLAEVGVEVPPPVDALLAALLAKAPEDRPLSMEDVERSLDALAIADGPPPPESLAKPRGRRGRGRAARAAAGGIAREGALRKLSGAKAPSPGRRLPGHEVLDGSAAPMHPRSSRAPSPGSPSLSSPPLPSRGSPPLSSPPLPSPGSPPLPSPPLPSPPLSSSPLPSPGSPPLPSPPLPSPPLSSPPLPSPGSPSLPSPPLPSSQAPSPGSPPRPSPLPPPAAPSLGSPRPAAVVPPPDRWQAPHSAPAPRAAPPAPPTVDANQSASDEALEEQRTVSFNSAALRAAQRNDPSVPPASAVDVREARAPTSPAAVAAGPSGTTAFSRAEFEAHMGRDGDEAAPAGGVDSTVALSAPASLRGPAVPATDSTVALAVDPNQLAEMRGPPPTHRAPNTAGRSNPSAAELGTSVLRFNEMFGDPSVAPAAPSSHAVPGTKPTPVPATPTPVPVAAPPPPASIEEQRKPGLPWGWLLLLTVLVAAAGAGIGILLGFT